MRTSLKILRRSACLYLLAASFVVLCFHPVQSFTDEEPKRVLIVFGDDVNHPAISTINQWGTRESKLPAGSIILNREPSLWQLYRGYIIAIVVVASLQSLLVIFLVITNTKRKHMIAELRQSDERFANAKTQPVSLTTRDTGRASSDVTERVAAKQALQESEARFRNMADNAPVIIWVHSETEGTTYINQKGLDFTGRPLQGELGTGWQHLIHPKDLERCREIYTTALNERRSFTMEYRLRRHDGVYRWIFDSASPRFLADGRLLGYTGSCIDITDRKQAEEAALQAKDELRLIADSLPVLVSQIDTNAHYTFNNLAYETWFGQPREQITGRHLRDLLGESAWQKIRPHIERVLEGHDVFYEDDVTYRSGPPRSIKVSLMPIRDQSGNITGAVSLVSDITESRRAQQVLRDLSSRLIKAQEEERSRVARELHDDLSQKVALLSIELDYAERHLATRDLDLTPTIQRARISAEDISEDIHRISHQLHPSRLDHLGLVKAVKAYLQEISTLHELEIDFRSDGFPANLPKDVTLCVFRIIQESLRNTIKHSGAHRAEIVLKRSPTELRATVSDHGCGFDTNSEKMTSGLGLIGMTERLRLVGGQIAIWSAPQEGTRIDVCVPLSKSKSQSAVEEIPQPTLTVSALGDETTLPIS
jgi:PAS domain S-box-containing protein